MPFSHLRRDPNKITGLTLLEKINGFTMHSQGPEEWEFDQWDPNSYQIKQISILCEIFTPECYHPVSIESIFKKIMSGSFILYRSMDTYKDLFTIMTDKVNSKYRYPIDLEWDLYRLQNDFENLYDFKLKIERITKSGGNVIEMSPEYSFAYNLKKRVSMNINLTEINEQLCSVVDPTNRVFTLDELIKDYNYPIDIEDNDD